MRVRLFLVALAMLVGASVQIALGQEKGASRPGHTEDWPSVIVSPRGFSTSGLRVRAAPQELPPPGSRRWWASLVAQLAVGLRLADSSERGRVATWAESALEDRRFQFDLGRSPRRGLRLRLVVGERGGGPSAGLKVIW